MYCFVAQDWVTIRGQTGVTSISQGEQAWLDLGTYRDLVVWLEVKEGTGTFAVVFETAATKDDSAFGPAGLVLASPGVTVTPILVDIQLVVQTNAPPARWFRWRLANNSPSSTWDLTFRILVAANTHRPRTIPVATMARMVPGSPSIPLNMSGAGN